DAAVIEVGRKDRVDQDAHLTYGYSECGRPHEHYYPAHSGIRPPQRWPREHADSRERGDLQRELQHAADEHRPGKHYHRRIEKGREKQRPENKGEIEQRRGQRRNREAAPGVEDAARERNERDEEN